GQIDQSLHGGVRPDHEEGDLRRCRRATQPRLPPHPVQEGAAPDLAAGCRDDAGADTMNLSRATRGREPAPGLAPGVEVRSTEGKGAAEAGCAAYLQINLGALAP